ncbi:MAG: hypothetical protein GX785_16515 [Armatimonadetes bacterium]|nr:hypothetical protein [Armatimonadota bacterium]
MSRQWIIGFAGILAALCLLAPGALADTTPQEVEDDQSLETKFVTPHKAWARPYAGGRVRALFIVNGGNYSGSWFSIDTRLREPIELLQRFDMTGDAILTGSSGRPDTFLGGTLGYQRAERLLSKPYDLYVFANLPMERFPAKLQYLVMEQVAKGAGLLCCGAPASEFMVAKRQIAPLPDALRSGLPALDGKKPEEVIHAYQLGKGRGVWLKYDAWALTPRQAFSYRRLAEYDYRMLLVGRAALWAVGREAPVSLSFGEGNGTVQSVSLASNDAKPLAVKVALELRRAEDGQTWALGEVPVTLEPGKWAQVPVRLPKARAGDYFIDAIARGSRGIVGCGAHAMTVSTPAGVERVELEKSFVERGESIGGKVVLRGTPPAGSTLRLCFRDSYHRILDQRDLRTEPGQTEYAFQYRAGGPDTILMRAQALLLASNGDEIEMKEASFTAPKRRRGEFTFLQWDAPNDVPGYYAWRRLQEAGQNVCLIGSFSESKPHELLQACDASLVPYSTRILDPKDEFGYMQPTCWNHEPAVTEHVQKIVNNQLKRREHGVYVYSLGDEGVTLGCCVHPSCIQAYRRYLAREYGTIDKLNASWGTTYKSFEEVDLLDHRDNMEQAALEKGLYARWYDRQAFARYNLMQFSGRFVETYKRLDPHALTGFEGTGGFGDDYDTILGTNTFYSPYPGIGDDILRSAAPRDLIRANWMGYSKTGDALSDAAWRMVMKEMNSVWFWMWTGIGSWRGYLNPALDFWPATADLTEEMRPVREGLGDLLMRSEVTHSGIGIFYSVPSALSGRVENSREFNGPENAHLMWTRLIYENGHDFRYLTSGMLKQGALDKGGFKVLLLPMAQAIAPEEAAAIRRFVQAGGTIIADVRPGIYDGHCKPVLPGALDDLFGFRRTGRGKGVRGDIALKGRLGEQAIDVTLRDTIRDPEVEPAGAEVMARAEDGSPLLLVNRAGAGRAILLNFQMSVANPEAPEAMEARRLAKALLEVGGARAAITFSDPKGEPMPFTETRVWRNGDALVFGLWRQMQCAWFGPKTGTIAGKPVPARVTLPEPRHVYDLRAGKYLGKVDRIDTRLRWGRASFYLALPYPIRGVDLSVSQTAPAPGTTLFATIRLNIPAGSQERHAVCVKVFDPEGREMLWGQQVVILENGTGRVSIPIAYNDTPGKWRVRATELFSGQSAEASWTIAN